MEFYYTSLHLRTWLEMCWNCGWWSSPPMCLLLSNCPSWPLFSVSVRFLPSEAECCGTLWPSVSWLCPGRRTARWPTSRSCRTLTGPGWVGSITRFSEFCYHIGVFCVLIFSEKHWCEVASQVDFFLIVCRDVVCRSKEGPRGFVLNWQHHCPVYCCRRRQDDCHC